MMESRALIYRGLNLAYEAWAKLCYKSATELVDSLDFIFSYRCKNKFACVWMGLCNWIFVLACLKLPQ